MVKELGFKRHLIETEAYGGNFCHLRSRHQKVQPMVEAQDAQVSRICDYGDLGVF